MTHSYHRGPPLDPKDKLKGSAKLFSSSGALSSPPVRSLVWTVDEPFVVKTESVFPVEWRLQSPKLVGATSKYRYHLIKLCKTISSGREEEHRDGFFPSHICMHSALSWDRATSWQRPRCPLTRTRAVIWQSVYGSNEPCPRTRRSGHGRIRTEDRLIRSPTP